MNERFFSLPAERQGAIVNAAYAVFAADSYRHASTDDIAARAGISKGLLFHYFESKRELYRYLYRHSAEILRDSMLERSSLGTETDFFALFIEGQQLKVDIMKEHPCLLAFILRAYYEENPTVSDVVAGQNTGLIDSSRRAILERVDRRPFQEGVDPGKLLDLILWAADGFMRARFHRGRRSGDTVDLDALNAEFLECLALLKRQCYREEYR